MWLDRLRTKLAVAWDTVLVVTKLDKVLKACKKILTAGGLTATAGCLNL